MNRRLFFKNLIGGTAAVAIAPKLFAEITEHEYKVEGVPTEPDKVFDKGEGFWVFQDEKLIAWSALPGVVAHYEREAIDVSRDPRYSTVENPVPSYREYRAGRMSAYYDVENLHVEDSNAFNKMVLTQIICVLPDGVKLENSGVWTRFTECGGMDFSSGMGIGRETRGEARYEIVGNTKTTQI